MKIKKITEKKNVEKNKSKIKAVIFDFDDTLVNTKDESLKRHRKVAKKAGIYFDEKRYLELYGGPWPDMLFELFGDNTENFLAIYLGLGLFRGGRIEGIENSIRKLASKNIILGVLSSGTKEFVLKRLKKEIDCSDLFDSNIIISKDDTKKHKPSKEAFNNIYLYLKAKNISNNEIIYCGDLLIDFKFAENIKVGFIAIASDTNKKEDFIKAGVGEERIISSVKNLPEKLEELKLI